MRMIKKTELIKYTKNVIKVLWENDKAYLFYVFFDTVISSILPFIELFLVKFSIDMLTNGNDIERYIYTILSLIVICFILRTTQSFLNYKRDVCGNMIGIRMYEKLYRKTMNLDYEMLLDKNIMERRELA